MKRWEAIYTHVVVALLVFSGLLYGVMKYLLAAYEPDSPLGHPLQPVVVKMHILVGPFFVFALGLLFQRHIMTRVKAGEPGGWRSGWAILMTAAPLVLSGYLVQAFTPLLLRQWSGWIHAGLGLLFALAYLFHPRRVPQDEVAASPARLPVTRAATVDSTRTEPLAS